MAKKVIGFNNESDFDRMAKAVRRDEATQMAGQRHRRLYPVNAGSGGGIEVRFEVVSVDSGADPKSAVVEVLSTDASRSSVPTIDEDNEITVYDKAGCYITSPYASLVGQKGYARYMKNVGSDDKEWEITQLCQP